MLASKMCSLVGVQDKLRNMDFSKRGVPFLGSSNYYEVVPFGASMGGLAFANKLLHPLLSQTPSLELELPDPLHESRPERTQP